MNKSLWHNCYDDGWQTDIVPEAFSHPAKFSRGLIHRIYKHSKEMGWVKPGDWVLDPFSGVALGGLDALSMGLNWVGVELEEKFVRLGEQNIELWERNLRGWPNLGTARIVQGDSRRLKEVMCNEMERANKSRSIYAVESGLRGTINQADLIISSPPYAESDVSATYAQGTCRMNPQSKHYRPSAVRNAKKFETPRPYGQSPGQLGSMKEGDFDCVISSPPYAEVIKRDRSQEGYAQKPEKQKYFKSTGSNNQSKSYSQDDKNLSNLPEGSFDLVCSSPPYEGCLGNRQHEGDQGKYLARQERYNKAHPEFKRPKATDMAYSGTKGNLGGEYADTFWSASREIVQGCYDLLKPGGHAIWVTKDYVKAKKRVPFSDRWLALCESVGFRLVCRHQAMLVKEHGTQVTINGEKKISTERKSFFRRLAESKGSPRIDNEDVICLEKI